MRILSVDDNQENLYLIEATARDHGHDVVSARNGVEALRELANGSFDLIVSDVLMPAMDGFRLCRIVKNDDIAVAGFRSPTCHLSLAGLCGSVTGSLDVVSAPDSQGRAAAEATPCRSSSSRS